MGHLQIENQYGRSNDGGKIIRIVERNAEKTVYKKLYEINYCSRWTNHSVHITYCVYHV